VTIVETDQIDIVATRPGTSAVRLVIADHLGWEDPDGHLGLLQAKLEAYLAFVESGQLHRLEAPPVPPAPEVAIELAVPSAPPEAAREFLERARAFLAERGIGFSVEIRPAVA
jgi:hypothetical protein